MIKLTYIAEPFVIDPEKIVSLRADGSGSVINGVCGETYGADQSPEEVTRKILEYKLLHLKYNAYMQGAANTDDPHDEDANLTTTSLVKISLSNLAGLEDKSNE